MNIEKEYILTIDDYISFQIASRKIQSKAQKHSYWQWIFFALPAIFILFSARYIYDDIVMYMGIIISLVFFIDYIYMNIFPEKRFIKYLKKHYYNNFIPENVKIIITEHFIIEYTSHYEQKILPEWVIKVEQNNDYILLFNNLNYAIIIPKKYFSDREEEKILNCYGNNK